MLFFCLLLTRLKLSYNRNQQHRIIIKKIDLQFLSRYYPSCTDRHSTDTIESFYILPLQVWTI